MINWILEKNVFPDTHFKIMHDTALELGHTVHHIKVVPFVHELDGRIVPNTKGNPAVCYGSIGIKKVAKKHGWKPGVFDGDFASTSYKLLGRDFLNYDADVDGYTDMTESEMDDSFGEVNAEES